MDTTAASTSGDDADTALSSVAAASLANALAYFNTTPSSPTAYLKRMLHTVTT